MRKVLRGLLLILTAPVRLPVLFAQRIAAWIKRVSSKIRAFFSEEPEDSPVTDAFAKATQHPQDILYHLDALRKHLFRALVVLIITTTLSFAFSRQILGLLATPLEGGLDALQAIDVTEPLGVFMRVSLLSGFVIALPYIVLEMWLFAAPGLKRRARIMGLLGRPAVIAFFLMGMAFAYYVILPTALPFLINFMGIATIPRPSTYIRFVTGLMFWIGVSFEFPLVIYMLAAMGLVSASALWRQFRLAMVILAIVAAAITPTVDPVNMFLVWVPLVLLYLLGIGLAAIAQGRRTVGIEESLTNPERS